MAKPIVARAAGFLKKGRAPRRVLSFFSKNLGLPRRPLLALAAQLFTNDPIFSMKNSLFFTAFALAAALGCHKTDKISVQGIVRDYKTKQPVAGVAVNLNLYGAGTIPLRDTSDAEGKYSFYFDGDFDAGRLFCKGVPAGYAGFNRPTIMASGDCYDVDLSVYPLDSYLRIRALNESFDGCFNGIFMGDADRQTLVYQTYSFEPCLLKGDSWVIDSIPIVGDRLYFFTKAFEAKPFYVEDTTFCPLGFTEVVIKI